MAREDLRAVFTIAFFWTVFLVSTLRAQPTQDDRGVVNAHRIVSLIQQEIGTTVGLAEKYGHYQHLDFAARDADHRLEQTLRNQDYTADEQVHLEKAKRIFESYVADPSRTAEVLASHYKEIRKAEKYLQFVHDSLIRRGGKGK